MTGETKDIPRDGRVAIILLLALLLFLADLSLLFPGLLRFAGQEERDCRRLVVEGGHHLLLPASCRPSLNRPVPPTAYTPLSFAPVPINRANHALLQTVRGIGPKLAENIVNYRQARGPITSPGQLQGVPGIGPKKAADFAPHFSFQEMP